MRLAFYSLLLLLAVGSVAAQSKDDEEAVDVDPKSPNSVVEGSGNAPSDDEDTVEGSGLPPSQVYTKLTTIVHARPVVQFKATTPAPEPVPPKKDPLPPIINMDELEKRREKERMDKEKEEWSEKENEKSVSIAPAIPRITTNRPESVGFGVSNYVLAGILVAIVALIIIVIVIIVVCRRKHKSDYSPAPTSPNGAR